ERQRTYYPSYCSQALCLPAPSPCPFQPRRPVSLSSPPIQMPCSQVVLSTEAGWDLRAVSLVYLSEIPSRLVQQTLETPPGQDLLCALGTERPPSP
ncbi:unnamed protein product, partial [Rangifer tarandus platyrhynchus]